MNPAASLFWQCFFLAIAISIVRVRSEIETGSSKPQQKYEPVYFERPWNYFFNLIMDVNYDIKEKNYVVRAPGQEIHVICPGKKDPQWNDIRITIKNQTVVEPICEKQIEPIISKATDDETLNSIAYSVRYLPIFTFNTQSLNLMDWTLF